MKLAPNVLPKHAHPQRPVLHLVLLQLHPPLLMIAPVKLMETAFPDTAQKLQICVPTPAQLPKELDHTMMDVTVQAPQIV